MMNRKNLVYAMMLIPIIMEQLAYHASYQIIGTEQA